MVNIKFIFRFYIESDNNLNKYLCQSLKIYYGVKIEN